LVPVIGAAFAMALELARLPFVDARTFLFASDVRARWEVHESCMVTGSMGLLVFAAAIVVASK
jgi:hypothetical protein